MRIGRSPNLDRTRVVVLTADPEFDRSARSTFGASTAIDLNMVSGRVAEAGDTLDVTGATVVVIDLDAGRDEEMQALSRLMARVGAWPPMIAVTR
jgi:pilus assembly protein CpaE